MNDLFYYLEERIYRIDKSAIHGNGVIADCPIKCGDVVGVAIVGKNITNNLGRWINHQKEPNCKLLFDAPSAKWNLVSTRDIQQNEEITANYDDSDNPDFIASSRSLGITENRIYLEGRMGSKTIAIDFDKTIHTYDQGWKDGTAYGGVIEGTREALEFLSKRYRLVILTARISVGNTGKVDPKQVGFVKDWLVKHDLDKYFSGITNVKTGDMLAIIDERAVHFDGNWQNALKGLRSIKGVV
jgi:hypothetical protein